MKIQSKGYQYAVNQKNVYQSTSKLKKESNQEVSGDQLEISASSKLFKGYVEKVKQMGESRSDRIKALKEQIQAGTYEVSEDLIATAIIDQGFFLE